MKTKLVIIVVALSLAAPAFAHRLDEYLQAIIVSVEQGHIRASMRLIPGVAVSTAVTAAIDVNGDGVLSEAEQQIYAQKVLRDLALSIDGQALEPRLGSGSCPPPVDIKEGIGEIHIDFAADLPAGGSHRTLVIQNHHEPRMSVYLMNCLVPQDRDIQIIAQNRNQNQSSYRVEYVRSGGGQDAMTSRWRSTLMTALAPLA